MMLTTRQNICRGNRLNCIKKRALPCGKTLISFSSPAFGTGGLLVLCFQHDLRCIPQYFFLSYKR